MEDKEKNDLHLLIRYLYNAKNRMNCRRTNNFSNEPRLSSKDETPIPSLKLGHQRFRAIMRIFGVRLKRNLSSELSYKTAFLFVYISIYKYPYAKSRKNNCTLIKKIFASVSKSELASTD
jgi:hypothetical protein